MISNDFATKGYRGKFVKLKTAKRRSISSNKWLSRQLNDPYVTKAKIDGYRSRAAYKLLEINDKFKLFRPNTKIVDLGAAPGGWSQIGANLTKSNPANPSIIAMDLLPIDQIPGVITIQKDFFDSDSAEVIKSFLGSKADIVMSDMAANTTGDHAIDHIRIMDLCEQAFEFALTILSTNGHFIAKIFQGGAENQLLNKIKLNFKTVKHFKPNSSRKDSSELYLVAMYRK